MIIKRMIALLIAAVLSCALVGISAVASWQRGGVEIEQWLWVISGCCLTASVHILPSLIESRSFLIRGVWLVAFLVCIFGHAQFFVLSEQHAGQQRISQSFENHDSTGERSPALIATEISKATALLTRLPVAKRDSQLKVVDALKEELEVAQKQRSDREQKVIKTESDPVGFRLSKSIGMTADAITLIVYLITAVILESMAVALWAIGLKTPVPKIIAQETKKKSASQKVQTKVVKTPADKGGIEVPVTIVSATVDPVSEIVEETQKVIQAVRAGEIKATVTDIRDYLRCSQKKALQVRRLVAAA